MTEKLAEQIRKLAEKHDASPAARIFVERLEAENGLTRELITDPNTLHAVALIETISPDAKENTT